MKLKKANNQAPLKIGLPRALLYYRYSEFYKSFFELLGFSVVLSPKTNREILEKGISLSVDESCLSSKIYLGHVDWLIDKCDFIFVPRIANFGFEEKLCTKFYGIYDIVANTFSKIKDKLLDINIDYINGKKESAAFLSLAKNLGVSKKNAIAAFTIAKEKEEHVKRACREKAIKQLESCKTKVFLVSHVYNTYDDFVAVPIISNLKSQGVEVIIASDFYGEDIKNLYSRYSPSLYWTYNKELLGALSFSEDRVDGIVIATAFPCGPDSMVNEILLRRQKKVHMINLSLDELSFGVGLETRLEAFVDMLKSIKNNK